MILEQSFVPNVILKCGNRISHNVIATFAGSVIIALLAQITIPLSFTPVPITGQTFGVALISLLWGKWRGLAAVAVYLTMGFSGLPVFAFGGSGISLGPTSGYLLGMLVAAYIMGGLADRGWTKKIGSTWLAAFFGSCVTFSCGLLVLSLYVPNDTLLMAGVLPFIPGDIVKTLLVCFIVRNVAKTTEQ